MTQFDENERMDIRNPTAHANIKLTMIKLIVISLIFVAALPVNRSRAQDDQNLDQPKPVQLPSDDDDLVLEYDSVGGFRMASPVGFTPTPRLRIFADGKVVCGRADPHFAEVEYRLSAKDLMELMEFIVTEQDFFSITGDSIASQIRQSGQLVRIADAPTSRFTVNLAHGEHQTEIYAAEFVARQFPKIDELQRIVKIQKRLRALIYRAHLGTDKHRDQILASINERLKKESAETKALTIGDIQSAATYTNGNFKVAFQRTDRDDDGNPTHSVIAKYSTQGKDPEPTLSVRVLPVARR